MKNHFDFAISLVLETNCALCLKKTTYRVMHKIYKVEKIAIANPF